ncbi:dihydroneopterin aldolase [Meridianimarinicoccus sp. MJW13]|uniref:dihydroneopterin aldolase n=1 Tax=Meridianimarinicoccus sp. MJW13 TaxID=2720031 RepID=UPI0018690C3B|nr:dihydroneopterin aldolase [Fluviibacterium sp. MJW13]
MTDQPTGLNQRPVAPVDVQMTAQSGTADKLLLHDHILEVEIGAFQQERGHTQRVRFNIVADLKQTAPGAAHDDVDGILSYDVLPEAIEDELAAGRLNLMETLAEGVAARVLAHKQVAHVWLRVEKLDRLSGALGVEIVRAAPLAPVAEAHAVPTMILVDDTVLADPRLVDRLAELAGDAPTVLCVNPVSQELPDFDGLIAPVARRITLLAYEQAAWRLASLDPRFVVVDSRTEMDWALRHDNISVWAPSKIVIDARDNAPSSLTMPVLAAWLARRLEAAEVLWLTTDRETSLDLGQDLPPLRPVPLSSGT